MIKIGSSKRIMSRLHRKLGRNLRDFNPPLTLFALLGSLFYSFYCLVLLFLRVQNRMGDLGLILGLIAVFLCLGLFFRKNWPKYSQKYLALYWYLTLSYCLPFFFTFLFLLNPSSGLRLMAFGSLIFWLVLLADLNSAFILLFLGILAAIGVFCLENGSTLINSQLLPVFALDMLFLLFIAFLVQRKNRLETAKKMKTAEAVGSGIAHELRTPLSAIIMGIEGAKKYFPVFIDTYQLAKQQNLKGLENISSKRLEVLSTLFDDIEREAKFSNVFIDMLLCNVKQDVYKQNAIELLSINDCIHQALQRYPFSEEQEKLIHWEDGPDFSFLGSAKLMEHVLLNLLKNALYQIDKAAKGQIQIRQTAQGNFNILCFKDTATGMSQNIKDILFQQHMGDTANRVGLGLAFCARVMKALGGRIECQSLEGEFSEFLLYFPRIKV